MSEYHFPCSDFSQRFVPLLVLFQIMIFLFLVLFQIKFSIVSNLSFWFNFMTHFCYSVTISDGSEILLLQFWIFDGGKWRLGYRPRESSGYGIGFWNAKFVNFSSLMVLLFHSLTEIRFLFSFNQSCFDIEFF